MDQQIDGPVDRWISRSMDNNSEYFVQTFFSRLNKRFAKNLTFPKNESKILKRAQKRKALGTRLQLSGPTPTAVSKSTMNMALTLHDTLLAFGGVAEAVSVYFSFVM